MQLSALSAGGALGRGRPIDSSSWPSRGPHRAFLEFLDRVHRENGTKSLAVVAAAMNLRARSRVSDLLRGKAPPADDDQARRLIRALGGSAEDADRGLRLYHKVQSSSPRNVHPVHPVRPGPADEAEDFNARPYAAARPVTQSVYRHQVEATVQSSRAKNEAAYWATVREICDRTGVLAGRRDELAEIAAFAVSGEGCRWLVGEPWAGKTSLLAEAALSMPEEVDVVCYFLSRREADADSSRFLAAVVPQLSALGGVEAPVPDVHQFRALWRDATSRADAQGRHLLLIIDGLDEDMCPPGLPSVAALLPAKAGGRTHVLVSSRLHPEMMGDIQPGHPVLQVRPMSLEPFAEARELARLAQKEIVDLLHHDGSDGLAAEVLGFLAAAHGPLTVSDLAALTGDKEAGEVELAHRRLIRELVSTVAARSVQPAGLDSVGGYQFAHESLLAYAQAHPDLNDPSFRSRIHQWAWQWQAAGWPAPAGGEGTPRYLLDIYPATLAREPLRLARLAGDIGWVEAAIASAGADAALATIRRAAAANPDSAPVAAMLTAVTGQAYDLRSLAPFEQPGSILRQLWMQAAELASGGMPAADRLAAEILSRLQLLPGPALTPRWTTRQTSKALSGQLGRHDSFIRAMELLADRRVAVGDDDHVLIWDPDRPGSHPIELGGDRTAPVEVVTADGRIITAQPEGRPLIRDPARPEVEPEEFGGWRTPGGRSQAPLEVALPGGHVIRSELTGMLLVRDPDASHWRGRELKSVVTALAALPDGRAVIGTESGSVVIWDAAILGAWPVELGRHDDQVSAITVLPDGRRIATGSYDRRVLLWDIDTRRDIGGAPAPSMLGGVGDVSAARITGDGRLITATGSWITIWSWDSSGPREEDLTPSGGYAQALAELPDQRVAIAGPYNKVQIWNPACRTSDTSIHIRPPIELGFINGDYVTAMAALADGRIVTGGYDGGILLWDPDNPGGRPTSLGFTNRRVLTVAVLPDGRVVSSGTDGRVLVWNPDELNADPDVIGRSESRIRVVTALEDGRVLTGGWDDGQILIWDTSPARSEPLELGRHNGHVLSAATLQHGLVATAGSDSRIFIWNLSAPGIPVLHLGCQAGVIAAAQRSQAASDLLIAHHGTGFSLWSFTNE